jgi:ABC-2 type transport system permease protein
MSLPFKTASTPWLLAHELRLSWRGFRAGRKGRGPGALIAFAILGVMIVIGGVFMGLGVRGHEVPIIPLSVIIADLVTAVVLTLMLSTTLAASADALYERNDLDLLFSSPLAPRKVLFVRALGLAVSAGLWFMIPAVLLLTPSIVLGHPAWLAVFVVLAAAALGASGLGLLLAMALFALIGPRRTRTVAQVMAALIGAAFFLASQYRNLMGGKASESLVAHIAMEAKDGRIKPPPFADLPLRAAVGEPIPLLILVVIGAGIFLLAAQTLGRRFADAAAATQGAETRKGAKGPTRAFAAGAFRATVRKELRLIGRDAGLLSQVLLRVLYLLPLAFVLARNATHMPAWALAGPAAAVAFLAGQVAGSLAWITVSAEDTPDLLAISPTPMAVLNRAKLTAALTPVAVLLAAPIGVLTWYAPLAGLWTAIGASLTALSAGLINVWRQKPGKRADFRRRRGGSFFAAIAELLIAALIGGATALAVAGWSVWAVMPLIVAGALMMALRRTDEQIVAALRAASASSN